MVENGSSLNEQASPYVKGIASIWRSIEREASSNHEKFEDGWASFSTIEETTEGIVMTTAGIAIAYLIDINLFPKIKELLPEFENKEKTIFLARCMLYLGLGQISYHLKSQHLGEYLHKVTESGDFKLTPENIALILSNLSDLIVDTIR